MDIPTPTSLIGCKLPASSGPRNPTASAAATHLPAGTVVEHGPKYTRATLPDGREAWARLARGIGGVSYWWFAGDAAPEFRAAWEAHKAA